jgi:hypothetical protein
MIITVEEARVRIEDRADEEAAAEEKRAEKRQKRPHQQKKNTTVAGRQHTVGSKSVAFSRR